MMEGKIEYIDNASYNGQYIEEGNRKIRQGNGTLALNYKDFGTDKKTFVSGYFNNNVLEGWGKTLFASGAVYEGSLKGGLQNGNGRYLFVDGSVYEGEWLDGKMHGSGVFMEADGTTISGYFKHGSFSTEDQSSIAEEIRIKEVIEQAASKVISFLAETAKVLGLDKSSMKEEAKKTVLTSTIMEEIRPFYQRENMSSEQQLLACIGEFFKEIDINCLPPVYVIASLDNLRLFDPKDVIIDKKFEVIFCEVVCDDLKKFKGLGLVIMRSQITIIEIFPSDAQSMPIKKN